jgi:hypothetical protein
MSKIPRPSRIPATAISAATAAVAPPPAHSLPALTAGSTDSVVIRFSSVAREVPG